MDWTTIATVGGSVITAILAGKVIEIKLTNRNGTQPGQSVTGTGNHPALISAADCKESRQEIATLIEASNSKVETALQKTTEKFETMNLGLVKLDGKVDKAIIQMDAKVEAVEREMSLTREYVKPVGSGG